MIYPNGKHYDILSYGTINGFRHEGSPTTAFKPCDCIGHARSASKEIRVTNKTIDPDDGVLNIQLVPELNHIPKADDRAGVNSKCCALCIWEITKQLRARLICYSVCNEHLCVGCFQAFHAESVVKI